MNIYSHHPVRYAIRLIVLICFLADDALSAVNVLPQISVGSMYTDNVYLSPTDEKYDFITLTNPGINFLLTGRNSTLTLSYNPTYAAYIHFPENNNFRHNALLNARSEIAEKTTVELSNAYLYTEDPVSDTDATARRGRTPYFTNTTGLGVVNRFGQEDSVTLRYEYAILDNRDPAIEDRKFQRPSLLLTYWLFPNEYAAEIELKYSHSDFEITKNVNDASGRLRAIKRFTRHLDGYLEYLYGNTDYIEESEDYRIHSPRIGFRWDEMIISSFSSSFGYFYRDNMSTEDDSGFVGSVESIYRWDIGNSFSLSGNAGQERTSFDAENLGFRSFYNVACSLNYQFSRLLAGGLSGRYRRDIYYELEPVRENTNWQAGSGLAFQAAPWMVFRLDYLFRKLDSGIEENSYVENRGMISVILRPRQEISLIR